MQSACTRQKYGVQFALKRKWIEPGERLRGCAKKHGDCPQNLTEICGT